MKIKLHDHYQNAGGVRLAPGEYDSADERLQGLTAYLLKTEHASLVPDAIVITGHDGPVGEIESEGAHESDESALPEDSDRDTENAENDAAEELPPPVMSGKNKTKAK